jgi:hypothetical protein
MRLGRVAAAARRKEGDMRLTDHADTDGILRPALRAMMLAAALVLTATPAGAAFQPRVVISDPGQSAENPQVAMNANGAALFVWQRFDGTNIRIQARARSAAGVLGPVEDISFDAQDETVPRVGIDASGNALIVWVRDNGTTTVVQGRTRSASGVLGPLINFSGDRGTRPRLAMNPTGKALVVWQRSDGADTRIQGRARSAAGVLGDIETYSRSGQDASVPEVAIDTQGDAVVAWQRSDGVNDRVQARTRSAAGVLGRITNLSRPGRHGRNPRLANDADGDALVVWEDTAGAIRKIQGRDVSAAGVFGSLQTISGEESFGPAVAVNAAGTALVVWRRTDGTRDRIQSRARPAGSGFEPILNLTKHSQSNQAASNPEVTLDSDGRATAIWLQEITAPSETVVLVWARHRKLSGFWTGNDTLSDPASGSPQIAMDANNNALAVWQGVDEQDDLRINISLGP